MYSTSLYVNLFICSTSSTILDLTTVSNSFAILTTMLGKTTVPIDLAPSLLDSYANNCPLKLSTSMSTSLINSASSGISSSINSRAPILFNSSLSGTKFAGSLAIPRGLPFLPSLIPGWPSNANL